MRPNQFWDTAVGRVIHVPENVRVNCLEHGVTYVVTNVDWFAGTVVVQVRREDGKSTHGYWFEARRFNNGPSPYRPGQIQNRCTDPFDPLPPYAEWNRRAYITPDQDEGGIV